MHPEDHFVACLNWKDIAAQLDQDGCAVLRGLLSSRQMEQLITMNEHARIQREAAQPSAPIGLIETVNLSRLTPVLSDELPDLFYRYLAPVANRWNEIFKVTHRHPIALDAPRINGRRPPLAQLTYLSVGARQELIAVDASERKFPLRVFALLSEPGRDFSGGELITTERISSKSSNARVLSWTRGDIAIISSQRRSGAVRRAASPVMLQHAISPVRRGKRIDMQLAFHSSI